MPFPLRPLQPIPQHYCSQKECWPYELPSHHSSTSTIRNWWVSPSKWQGSPIAPTPSGRERHPHLQIRREAAAYRHPNADRYDDPGDAESGIAEADPPGVPCDESAFTPERIHHDIRTRKIYRSKDLCRAPCQELKARREAWSQAWSHHWRKTATGHSTRPFQHSTLNIQHSNKIFLTDYQPLVLPAREPDSLRPLRGVGRTEECEIDTEGSATPHSLPSWSAGSQQGDEWGRPEKSGGSEDAALRPSVTAGSWSMTSMRRWQSSHSDVIRINAQAESKRLGLHLRFNSTREDDYPALPEMPKKLPSSRQPPRPDTGCL